MLSGREAESRIELDLLPIVVRNPPDHSDEINVGNELASHTHLTEDESSLYKILLVSTVKKLTLVSP